MGLCTGRFGHRTQNLEFGRIGSFLQIFCANPSGAPVKRRGFAGKRSACSRGREYDASGNLEHRHGAVGGGQQLQPADFLSENNRVVPSRKNPAARKYLELPFLCNLTSYGNNIVASVSEPYAEIAGDYISRYAVEHCFETPNLHVLMERLRPLGVNVCWMAEYWLPDLTRLQPLACRYELRLLGRRGLCRAVCAGMEQRPV